MTSANALMTAIVNDIGGEDIFAQQVMAYGKPGDVLMGLSTSGNAENVRRAMLVARARGLSTIAMTGESSRFLKRGWKLPLAPLPDPIPSWLRT